MLFQNNRRRYQFYLYKLNDLEHAEITDLITKNGGEVCANDKYPAIRLSNCKNYDGREPVFHINYIRECVECHHLLDLINYKIGTQGYYGCLMSILINGENTCSYVENNYSCYSSSHIKPSNKYHHPSNEDHSSGQGDSNMVQEMSNGAENHFTIKKRWSHPDTPLKDSQFIPPKSTLDSEFLPNRSPQSSYFLPEEERRDSEFMSAEFPRDSKFSPKESQQNSERLPTISPRDSEFLPQESQEYIEPVVIERIQDKLPGTGQIEFASRIPEPARFEELNYEPDIPRAVQSLTEDITLRQNSCPISSENITNVNMLLEGTNNAEHGTNAALPCSNINELYPGSGAKKKTEDYDHVLVGVERNDKISLNGRLERLRLTKLKTLDCSEHRRSRKKLFTKNVVVDEEPVSEGGKTRASPTILRDEQNKESSNIIKRHELTLSDIDNTDRKSTAATNNCDRSRSVDRTSSCETRGIGSKMKVLRKREERVSRKLENNSHRSTIPKSDKRNTAGSSTGSSNDSTFYDSDFPSSPEVDKAHNVKPNLNVHEAKLTGRITRNFSTWEQRKMINYLIEKRKISEGKGIAVWNQMINDGELAHRTPFSLNNHFRRVILPTIHRFKLKHKHMSEFQNLLKKRPKHRKNSK